MRSWLPRPRPHAPPARAGLLSSAIVVAFAAVAPAAVSACGEERSGPAPATLGAAAPSAPPEDRVMRVMTEEMRPMLEHPAMRARLAAATVGGALEGRAAEAAMRVGLELTARGIPRLPLAELETWNRVRLVMAGSSDALCAGMWTGGAPEALAAATVAALGEEDLRAWARLSSRAGVLELEAHGPVAVDPASLPAALEAIARTLPPGDRARFLAAAQAGVRAAPAEACFALKTLLRGAAELPPEARESALRALGAANAG